MNESSARAHIDHLQYLVANLTTQSLAPHGIQAGYDDSDVFYVWHAPTIDGARAALVWDGYAEWTVCLYNSPDAWERDEPTSRWECDDTTDSPVLLFARVVACE